MIHEYFGDGSKWGIEIRYLREDKKLGTAGALSLLETKPSDSFLVVNGDLLTNLNFKHLLDFHKNHHSDATMCVREYDHVIPYGVVNADNFKLLDIQEKPVKRYLVNAGMYACEPHILDLIPKDTYFDMTDLFFAILEKKMAATVFPLREYWLDIGQVGDYHKANEEWFKFFEKVN